MFHNLLDLRRPGQETLQKCIGRSSAQVSDLIQKKAQVIEGIQAGGFRRLHHRVDDGAGLRSLRCIAEQPVLPSNHKGPDGVFRQVVGDIHLAAVEE